jgi:hypothetical protein
MEAAAAIVSPQIVSILIGHLPLENFFKSMAKVELAE